MITEAQIREQLIGYLARRITLNEFEDWLVQQSWNMHLDSDDAAQYLVGMLELRLAEYSDDHLTDEGLERELKGLISTSTVIAIQLAKPTAPVWTSSSAIASYQLNLSVAQAA